VKGGWFPGDFGVVGQEERRARKTAGPAWEQGREALQHLLKETAEESQTTEVEQAAKQLKAGHITVKLKYRQKSPVQEMAIQKVLNRI